MDQLLDMYRYINVFPDRFPETARLEKNPFAKDAERARDDGHRLLFGQGQLIDIKTFQVLE
jgi:hypothetical protein